MTCLARNLTKLISAQPFFVIIVLLGLGIIGLTSPPFACCYDPPDYADTSEQAQLPTAAPSGEAVRTAQLIKLCQKKFSFYSILQSLLSNSNLHPQALVLKTFC